MTDVEPVLRSTLQFSTSVEVRPGIVGPLVRWSVYEQFSRKTSLRILPKLGMKLQHDEGKKRSWPFVRKNSRSLIIHGNASWPFS